MDANEDPYATPLTADVWVRVYHNETSRFEPFGPSDELRFTVGFPARPGSKPTTVGELLSFTFEQLNIDEPDQFFGRVYRQGRNRSLSVGDVVEIEYESSKARTAWGCERMGWRAVEVGDAQKLEHPAVVVQDPEGIAYVVNGEDRWGEETFPKAEGEH